MRVRSRPIDKRLNLSVPNLPTSVADGPLGRTYIRAIRVLSGLSSHIARMSKPSSTSSGAIADSGNEVSRAAASTNAYEPRPT